MPTFGLTGTNYIAPPALAPSKGGVLEVAEVRSLGSHDVYGTIYESVASVPASEITENPTDCVTVTLDQSKFHGYDFVESGPAFGIFTGVECQLLDNTQDAFEATASARLEAGSSRAVEQYLWNERFINGTDLNTGGAVSLRKGLRLLSEYAADNYAYAPIVHFSHATGIELTADRVLDFDGTLAGLAGDAVIGSGYNGAAGIGGAVAAADTAWIYATGRIIIEQGAIRTYGANTAVGASPTNSLLAIAERAYTASIDGFTVGVRVTLE